MRPSLAAASAVLLVTACMSNTSGTVLPACTGPNCTVGNPGSDGGGGADAGDGGDGGDAGQTDGGDAGPCHSFTSYARDFCRTGQAESAQLLANGCAGTLFLNNATVCTGQLDGGNAFNGVCNENGVQLNCAAPALPGTITCNVDAGTVDAGTTCPIVVCGINQGISPDGGCTP